MGPGLKIQRLHVQTSLAVNVPRFPVHSLLELLKLIDLHQGLRPLIVGPNVVAIESLEGWLPGWEIFDGNLVLIAESFLV